MTSYAVSVTILWGWITKRVKDFWSENLDEGDLGSDGCEEVKWTELVETDGRRTFVAPVKHLVP